MGRLFLAKAPFLCYHGEKTERRPGMNSIACVFAHPHPEALRALSRAARDASLRVCGTAGNARALLALIAEQQPHVVFLHALTPGWDEAEAKRALAALPLRRRPALIYLLPAYLPARQAAEFRPALPFPADARALKSAAQAALPLPVEEALWARAETLMARMGLPAHPARRWLAYAAAMAYNDRDCLSALSRALLPALAARFAIAPRPAAEAMRRLIDRAWTTGDIEAQYAFFGNTIDESRGKPTLTAFLATAAELMRLNQDTEKENPPC